MELAVKAISQRCKDRGQNIWDIRDEKVDMANDGETRSNGTSCTCFSSASFLDYDLPLRSCGLLILRDEASASVWIFIQTRVSGNSSQRSN